MKNAISFINDKTVNNIIDSIIKDICNRSGIGSEFQCIDDEIVQDIKDEWKNIIYDSIRGDNNGKKL